MRRKILIIGGGFSGCAVAIGLLRSEAARAGRLGIQLVEREAGGIGPGVAYGTEEPMHLLNVPAKNMSLFPDAPSHFLDWLAEQGIPATPLSFLPRPVYGRYLLDCFRREREANPACEIEVLQDEVTRLEPAGGEGLVATLASGRALEASRAVLAVGNFSPADPLARFRPALSPAHYLETPWGQTDWGLLSRTHRSIALIGTGLTAVDVMLSLRAAGFSGELHGISRHGLLPQVHDTKVTPHAYGQGEVVPGMRPWALLSLLRSRVAEGLDWRSAVDGLRPHTQALWRAFTLADRRAFLRHLVRYWDVHRHRMAPEIAAQIKGLAESGQVRMHAGRVENVRVEGEGVVLRLLGRHGRGVEEVRASLVINCTGPSRDFLAETGALPKSLAKEGGVRLDPLGLGLEVDAQGEVIGRFSPQTVFTIGAPRIGGLWETVAVPELRVQAQQLAARLAE